MNKWLVSNKLGLNINKSCYLNFSSLHNPSTNINVKIANKLLERKRVTKYLGVLIDGKLSWKYHIHSVNMKLRKDIGIISKLKDFVMKSTSRSLYFSFIHPYLDYNLLNWSSAPSSNMDCLRLSTKKTVQIILSKNKHEHAPPLFKDLNILPLDDLIKQNKRFLHVEIEK